MGLFSSNTVSSLDIEVKSKGAKKATDELDNLTQSSGKAERGVKSLGKGVTKFAGMATAIGGLATAVAALGAASKILANTAEQERVTAQLDAVLLSTGGSAGLAKDELLNMASALQEVTKYGDEAVIGAESLLLTFTKIGKETFPSALQATLNVATAMGTDLKSAAIQVGKALNDPKEGMSALSRSGITFSEDQKNVIKALVDTGREAEAQKLILIELETQFGNSARAARDTMGGALAALKNAFGDLLEGDTGAEGVIGVKDSLERLTAIMSAPSTTQAFQKIADVTITIANGMVKATTETLNFFGAIKFSRGEKITREIKDIDKSVSELYFRLNNSKADEDSFFFGGAIKGIKKEISDLQETRKQLVIEKAALDKEFKPKTADIVTESPITLEEFTVLAENPTKSSSKKRNSEIDKQARKLEQLLKDQKKSAADFRSELESLGAELDGTLAQATLQYNRNLQDLTEEGIKGKVSASELTEAHDLLTQQFEEEKERIKETLNPSKQLIEQLKFEASLIGLTNSERETAITLRGLEVEATEQQAAKIGELIAEIEAAKDDGTDAFKELTNAVEGFGNKATDAITDFAFGAETSFGDLVTSILKDLARLTIKKGIINPIVESITGSFGSGGDSDGGLFSSILGSIFGGGKANGGPVSAGNLYRVNETGDEFFQPNTNGYIRNKEQGGGTANVSITINSDGSSTSEGDQIQLAKKMEAAAKSVIINEQRSGGLLA